MKREVTSKRSYLGKRAIVVGAGLGGRRVSWLFFKARAKRPYLIHTGRASPAAAGSVTYRLRYAPSKAGPARTALPAAHFERNDITIICEAVH